MPETIPDGLRWPLYSDDPDVPRDIGFLAEDVQAALGKKADKASTYKANASGQMVQFGTRVGVTNGSGSLVVTFATPFASGAQPVVVAVPGDSPGVVGANTTYVTANSATGFTFNGMAANTQIRVNYAAVGQAA